MRDRTKKLNSNIIIACILVVFLAGITVSLQAKFEPVSITVLPQVPREGQPLLITFNLNNPSDKENRMSYEFYANGVQLMQGKALLEGGSTKQYTYVYPESPKLGERITFLAKTESEQGSYEKILSMPAYSPQIWTSFVSFASFSTSLMSSTMSASITSMEFYSSYLGDTNKPNVGLVFSIVLIIMLIYLEITQPLMEKSLTIIGGLRIRFSRLSAILLIVFLGMVFTKVAMMIPG